MNELAQAVYMLISDDRVTHLDSLSEDERAAVKELRSLRCRKSCTIERILDVYPMGNWWGSMQQSSEQVIS